ncbi:hypothetical protein G6F59_015067 [Rhizopus arrhizus]|nr:hypothetical protein G6F59_015067 [Rhizopus arrhizus]
MSDEIPARFDPLPAALQTHLQHQRSLIAARVAAGFPSLPVQWPLPASTLQRVVDAELIDRDDGDGWEALGVAFGDTLAQRVPGLVWMQVTDAWGIDAVLRYADSSLQIGASTLLLKRVEQGEVIDIAHLLAWLEEFVATRADDYVQRPSTTTRRSTGTAATAAGPWSARTATKVAGKPSARPYCGSPIPCAAWVVPMCSASIRSASV